MPVLRVTWLDNMAGHHASHGNLAEAAQCKLYIAFLVGSYLQEALPRNERGGVPKNASFFAHSSPNLAKEHANPKLKFQVRVCVRVMHVYWCACIVPLHCRSVLSLTPARAQEGMYDSPTFTVSGLVRTITMAVGECVCV
jgi:hypothetical protein